MLRDMTNLTMTKKDTQLVDSYLSQAGVMFNKISGTTLRQLESNPQLAQMIETYNNSFVRKGQIIGNTAAHVNGLIRDIQNRFAKTAGVKDLQPKVRQHSSQNVMRYSNSFHLLIKNL